MELILMRHGRAEERVEFARGGHLDDGLRPLTEPGRKRLRRALPGLQRAIPRLELLVTSPLLRARQTATVIQEAFALPLTELAALSPGEGREEITSWLGKQQAEVVMLVGHEPELGALASWYLTGSEESFLPLKKGGICWLHFDGNPAAAQGKLQLLLSGGQLCRLLP